MKKMLLNVVYIVLGVIVGSIWSNSPNGAALAQFAPPSTNSGDALWHLPKFGSDGWFLHASNGRVRACNVNNVSVVGAKPGPRCSGWE